MKPSVSIIVSAYNRAGQLECALSGYRRQTHREFEVIVADDGSGPEVKALVDRFRRDAAFPIRYVYQEDRGFRKSRILNVAAHDASSAYIIFADQDCIPHRDFVRAHWAHRSGRTVLCGRRVLLGKHRTDLLTPQHVLEGELERINLRNIVDAMAGDGSHWDEAIGINAPWLRRLLFRREPSVLGSNFSLPRALFESVKGFDDGLIGYGGEETDLERRLRLDGVRFKWVTHLAIQYHTFHPPTDDPVAAAARIAERAQAGVHLGRGRLSEQEYPQS
jgi:glycosyltransferase involved in cell wall biosynthesis